MNSNTVVTLSHEDPAVLAMLDVQTEGLISSGKIAEFSQFLVVQASSGPNYSTRFISALASAALGESIGRIKARGEQEEEHGDAATA